MNIVFLWNWPVNEFTGGVGIVTKVLAKEMQNRGLHVAHHRLSVYGFITRHRLSA